MKIAYLANVRFPSDRAHSVQIVHMAKAFAENGAELDLFVNKRSALTKEETEKYYSLSFSFTLKRISHGYFSPQVLLTYYLSEFFFTLNFFISHKPKAYDRIYSRSEWIIWILSLLMTSKKLVWESHEAKLNFPARQILRKGIKTVVISEGIFEEYTKFGVTESQMLVAHDGIDDSFFGPVESKGEARTRLGLPLNKKIAMYIGGFDAWKGVETFLKAAELCPEVMFVAIGGRSAEIDRFKTLYPKVTFLGQKPYAELKGNQQAADVIVIPNSGKEDISAKYTSPLKLFAHMASGVPLVVSNIPSISTVTGDVNLSMFEPDNKISLAETIRRVFNDYHSCIEKAKQLRQMSSEYTWSRRAGSIINFTKM